jgi:hypothetical protein
VRVMLFGASPRTFACVVDVANGDAEVTLD